MTPLQRAADKTFRSLKVRNYRLYFFSQIVSMSGTWMQSVAQIWLVLELTGSGTAIGVVTGLQFTPVLLFGMWSGVLADRVDKRKLIIGTQLSAATLALILGLITVTGIVELWMIHVLALAFGTVTALEVPARQSFVIEMVGPDLLPNAVGLNSTVFTAARVVGPAIAAVLISSFGVAVCFLINSASYLAVIGGLTRMDPEDLRRPDPAERTKGQVAEGLRYVWRTPVLRSALLLMAVVGTLAFNFRVLLPLMATALDGGAGVYGMMSAVMGVGTVAGALFAAARARPSRRLLVASALAFGILIIAAGLAPGLAVELLVLLPLGAVSILFVATCNATLQLNASDWMRGRVMALYSVVFLGTTPIGSPTIGWVADSYGVRTAFLVAGLATVAGGIAVMWGMRRMAARTGPPEVRVETLPEDVEPAPPATAEVALTSPR